VGCADAGRPRGLCSTRTAHRSRPPVGRLSRSAYAVGDPVGRSESCSAGTGPRLASATGAPTLRERLPVDLWEAASGPDFDALPFRSLYLFDHEWAAEIANQTVHGSCTSARSRMGLVAIAQMALVKPNGLLGTDYLQAIRPFRHLSCTRR
jgi:hypothetical protein